VVWLRASPAVLGARVGGGDDRPLLAGPRQPPITTLERLSAQREPAYQGVADVPVDTDGRTVDEVAAAVVEEFQSWNG
jgi:shikimate kinase